MRSGQSGIENYYVPNLSLCIQTHFVITKFYFVHANSFKALKNSSLLMIKAEMSHLFTYLLFNLLNKTC